MRRAVLGGLVAVCACGDRDDPSAWSLRDSAGVAIVENSRPRHTDWRLGDEPLVEIGSAEGAPLRDPVSVIPDSRRRIHVADRGAPGGGALLVYDDEGAFLFRAGTRAAQAAPAADTTTAAGDVVQLWWAAPYRGDSAVAFDLAAKKLIVYTPEGSFGRELPIPTWRREGAYGVPGYTAGAVGPMRDGSFLTYPGGALDRNVVEGPGWYRHDLLRLSPEGERWDTLGVYEIFQTWVGEAWTEPYPFGAVAFAVPVGDGFAFTTGATFELRHHDAAGALRRVVRRAHAPETVNAADLEQYRSWYLSRARASGMDEATAEQLSQQLAAAHHPDRRPALSNLIADDEGNLWAEEYRWVDPAEVAPSPAPTTWSVFGPDGRWLAQVQVPVGFLLSSVSGDRVHGVAVAPSGAKSVRVYPLIR
jgi:hypothetical protein